VVTEYSERTSLQEPLLIAERADHGEVSPQLPSQLAHLG
jgi:hypothetical protein